MSAPGVSMSIFYIPASGAQITLYSRKFISDRNVISDRKMISVMNYFDFHIFGILAQCIPSVQEVVTHFIK